MAFNRTRLLTLAMNNTVTAMHAAVEELEGLPVQASLDGLDSEVETWIDEIKATEKAEFIANAGKMFPGLSPGDAAARKRLLSRRTSEARLQAAWIVAELAGATSANCEAYRKAAGMRISWAAIDKELSELIKDAGIEAIACGSKGNRTLKAKATHPAIMALWQLRSALKVLERIGELETALRAKAAA